MAQVSRRFAKATMGFGLKRPETEINTEVGDGAKRESVR
jgi:hypothetical protein